MKIVIFYGSIHKKRGNTYVIIDEFVKGARDAGAEVDVVFLAEKKIKNCAACLTCWTKTPGRCVIKDDMSELLDMFMASDIVVMATPVYVHNVTGIMKTFIDRIIPITDPHLVKMENGYGLQDLQDLKRRMWRWMTGETYMLPAGTGISLH